MNNFKQETIRTFLELKKHLQELKELVFNSPIVTQELNNQYNEIRTKMSELQRTLEIPKKLYYYKSALLQQGYLKNKSDIEFMEEHIEDLIKNVNEIEPIYMGNISIKYEYKHEKTEESLTTYYTQFIDQFMISDNACVKLYEINRSSVYRVRLFGRNRESEYGSNTFDNQHYFMVSLRKDEQTRNWGEDTFHLLTGVEKSVWSINSELIRDIESANLGKQTFELFKDQLKKQYVYLHRVKQVKSFDDLINFIHSTDRYEIYSQWNSDYNQRDEHDYDDEENEDFFEEEYNEEEF